MFIWLKLKPSVLLSILNPVSLVELSVHDKLMAKQPTATATRLDGGRGVASGVAVGVGVALGVGIGVGVGVPHNGVVLALAMFEYAEFPAPL
jgi:hypothetical protein